MSAESDKTIDFALAVFNDRRAEIRERLGYRDQWLSRYVFGVVAFLGVSLGIEKLDPDARIILCLVMPVISLIVAINAPRMSAGWRMAPITSAVRSTNS